ncbi:hypothetical protein GGTG_02887 [Gaeumannomyces tritici R3-111a-1]|uniref:Uncharacterized protein n=1 Tax=Gaeumannomyces tritici (strain R3-111a-1) TaxID=644352 RepID=J3NNN0_GAET3|nr:hypothetical protein GGTG_02887 [Gaeumannomyces tritici R3-111a-1]EJT77782.1 hypothetical protein GGTG_02887 [Gaeumannomyces tritici R3-111a-1]
MRSPGAHWVIKSINGAFCDTSANPPSAGGTAAGRATPAKPRWAIRIRRHPLAGAVGWHRATGRSDRRNMPTFRIRPYD